MKENTNKSPSKESTAIRIKHEDYEELSELAYQNRSGIPEILSKVVEEAKDHLDEINIPEYHKPKIKAETKGIRIYIDDREFLKDLAHKRKSKIIDIINIFISEYKKKH
ncbi:hypothetical protein ACFRGK_06550 [Bacillus subtilis]|uniref:hypothetical protein n=1 Tax=Bacillus subtilis TaxID=1423 RepID=UPI00279524DE|nr:hypothetical protein [Bacillus subtilis]